MTEENTGFDFNEYKSVFDDTFDSKKSEFEEERNQKLVISLVGSVNAGKSMTINALTGMR